MTQGVNTGAGRVPPYSEEAERGALGALLLDATRLIGVAIVQMRLTGEAFYVPKHRMIFEAVCELAGRERGVVDVLTVGQLLRDQGGLEAAGEMAYLNRMVDETPTAAHGEYYLGIVRRKWMLRQLIAVAREIEQDCYLDAGEGEAETVVLRCQDKLANIVMRESTADSNETMLVRIIERWEAAQRGDKKAFGIPMPDKELTNVTMGLEPGLFILAGRPSAGKTTFEGMLRNHAASLGHGVLCFQLDDEAESILERDLSRMSQVSLPRFKRGFVGESHLARARESAEVVKRMPMWIRSDLYDIREICACARAMKLKHNIGLVTLDYVQLVEASELGRMSGDDRVRTGLVSRRLKKLALELRIPVVMLSQLSRSGDQREGRPRLTDLRDSGCLEQDASKVMMLYKDEEKAEAMDGENPEATKHKRPIWVDLQKHKNGECGRMEFWMFPPYFRMERAAPGFGDDRLPDEAMELARKQGAAGARAAAADGFDGMTDVEEMVAQMELMK